MLPLALIFAIAGVFLILERLFPGRALPTSPGWYLRAATLNAVQLGIVLLAGITWTQWMQGHSLLTIAGAMPAPWQGLLAWFVGTFVFYWWHRARHRSDFLWRCLHQIHHSPVRIETLTSFYKHPLEIALNSILSTAILFPLLGASPEAIGWYSLFAATGEFCYHANLCTPRWFGWFLQRPELHAIHHQRDVHDFNYGDITWWDRLFGTFREADDFAAECGFDAHKERRLGKMLRFGDVHADGEPRDGNRTG